ncbi:hypothetical protein LTR53_020041, partial [Teratosphaeriaceae sp. CCFEE 6253]
VDDWRLRVAGRGWTAAARGQEIARLDGGPAGEELERQEDGFEEDVEERGEEGEDEYREEDERVPEIGVEWH